MAGFIRKKYGSGGSDKAERVQDLDKQLGVRGPTNSASAISDIVARQATETDRQRTNRQAQFAQRSAQQTRSGSQGSVDSSQFPSSQPVQVVGERQSSVLQQRSFRGEQGAIIAERLNNRSSFDRFIDGALDTVRNVKKRIEERFAASNVTQQGDKSHSGTAVANSANVVQPNLFEVFPNDRFRSLVQSGKDFIPNNVLDGFIDVQYHVTLSMLPKRSLMDVQTFLPLSAKNRGRAGGIDALERRIKTEGSVVIASTGDVFRNEEVRLIPVEETLATEEFDAPGEFLTATPIDEDISVRNYYNIKDFELVNNMSPDENNPIQSDLVEANMTLVEPHGLQLPEDIRLLSDLLGYEEINTGRVVYRLDISFSGYNQDTGEWISRIDFDDKLTGFVSNNISYYFNISHIDAKVEHTGTTYALKLVPYGGIAWRPEEAIVDASAIFTSEDLRFGDFLKQLEIAMETQKDQRTHGIIKRKYRFHAPKQLLDSKFFTSDKEKESDENKLGFVGEESSQGSTISGGSGVDVMTLLHTALKDVPLTWENFLKEKDPSFIDPRIHWVIRYNVVYGNDARANSEIQDIDSITIEYIIEPFITYKKSTITNKDDAREVTKVNSQVNRIQNMAEFGMINRIYNYIHTENNGEVIDLNIDLQAFYFQQLNRQLDSGSLAGDMTQTSASNVKNKRDEIKINAFQEAFGKLPEPLKRGIIAAGVTTVSTTVSTIAGVVTAPVGAIGAQGVRVLAETAPVRQTISSLLQGTPTVGPPTAGNPVSPDDSTNTARAERIESTLERVLGRNIDNPDPFCNFLGNTPDVFTILGGGFNDTPRSAMVGATSEAQGKRNKYQANLDDHLENDLLHIDSMVVRGDPIWLLSPYATESVDTAIDTSENKDTRDGNEEERRGIVRTLPARVMFLRMFAPRQDDLMNPNRRSASTSCSIIGGFYEVLNVTSKFEGGKFTQTIDAAKIHHINFVEGFVTFGNDNDAKTTVETTVSSELRNERPKDEEQEILDKGVRSLEELNSRPVVLIGDPAPRRPDSEDEGIQ